MKISVILPVYNDAERAAGTLRSVLACGAAPVEAIVVDDGSTEGGMAELKALVGARGQVVFLERNRGVSAARNAGVALATGDYIAFVDCGDRLRPGGLEKLLHAASAENADIAIGGCLLDIEDDLKVMGASGTGIFPEDSLALSAPAGTFERAAFPELLINLLQNDLLHPAAGRLYRAALAKTVRFDETVLNLLEDEAFNLDCLRKAGRAAVIPETVCWLPGADAASLSTRYDDDRLLNIEKLWDRYLALLADMRCALASPVGRECQKQLMHHYLALTANWRRAGDFASPIAMFQSAKQILEMELFRAAARSLDLDEQFLVSSLNGLLDLVMPRLRRISVVFDNHGDWLQYAINSLEMIRMNWPPDAQRFADLSRNAGAEALGVGIDPDRLWRVPVE